jgi:hypothetical protein
METTNGTPTGAGVFAAFHRMAELPGKLEGELRLHPFAATAAIAGLAFIGGMIFGSRTARAMIVAATPVIATRLLDGPLGDDLTRYVRSAFSARPVASQTAS